MPPRNRTSAASGTAGPRRRRRTRVAGGSRRSSRSSPRPCSRSARRHSHDPSASNTPARKPFATRRSGAAGQAVRPGRVSTLARADVRIGVIIVASPSRRRTRSDRLRRPRARGRTTSGRAPRRRRARGGTGARHHASARGRSYVVAPDVAVAAHHPAHVSRAGSPRRRVGVARTRRSQAARCRASGAGAVHALLGARDVLPAAIREKAVVAARDELGAVLQGDPVRRLDRRPVREHLGRARSGGTRRGARCRRSRPRGADRPGLACARRRAGSRSRPPRSMTQACVQPRYGLIVHRNGMRDRSGTRFSADFACTS